MVNAQMIITAAGVLIGIVAFTLSLYIHYKNIPRKIVKLIFIIATLSIFFMVLYALFFWNSPPSIVKFDPNLSDPQVAGKTINWNTDALDPDGDQILYEFLLRGPSTGNELIAQTGWISDNTWAWKTNEADIGKNQVEVWVRDGKHAGLSRFDDNNAASFKINRPINTTRPIKTVTSPIIPSQAQQSISDEEIIRSTFYNLGNAEAIWDYSNFAGFYYDIDENIGTESITFYPSAVSGEKSTATLSDEQDANGIRGVVYTTTAQAAKFKFKGWGKYDVIGFLADKYFAAYLPDVTTDVTNAGATVAYLYDTSKNRNLMTNEQISKVLVDDNTERTFTSANPLVLQEGYQLAVKSIDTDGNKLYVELTKNGQEVDDFSIQPSITNAGMADKTYYYKTSIGDTADIIQIAVHFKNAFRGIDTNIATVDGIFQISDTPTSIKVDQCYDKMSIRNVDAANKTIKMDNKDNAITLSKNRNIVLMQNIYIKTADQDDISVANPLRYCIYKKITAPGTYQIRGTVANLSAQSFTWTSSNFAGFYYDINKNIGTESITFYPSAVTEDKSTAILSDHPDANNNRGIIYSTTAQAAKFKFKAWGMYGVIGFLADKYFAAYLPDITTDVTNAGATVACLYDTSKNRNLMTNEQISKVLVDDNTERTFTSANPLVLQEGYQLAVKSIDTDGNKVYVELTKNGQIVNDFVIQPSITNAGMADKTYYYRTSIGDTADITQIAVHFKNAFHGADTDIATIDGIFQISDTPTTIQADQQYDKMSIRNIDLGLMTITMDNKNNSITLSKNRNIVLMQNVYIKTADQDNISAASPLRYYIYKAVKI